MAPKPKDSARPYLPKSHTIGALKKAAKGCRGCPLYKNATQTVFGEGDRRARLVLVGEQPGDQEDLAGHPFVGPSGKLLDRALAEAGIERAEVYVTNAVKHFKWIARGKRRLHAKPGPLEIRACFPWLEAELGTIGPDVVVCLGATAARAVFGRVMAVNANRGNFLASPLCEKTLVSFHPSGLLRMPDEASRERAFADFVADLKLAKSALR